MGFARLLAATSLVGVAAEEDLALDLRILSSNASNATTAATPANASAVDLSIPTKYDFGLGKNASAADTEKYANALATVKSYKDAYLKGIVKALGFDGLKTSDLSGLKTTTKDPAKSSAAAAATGNSTKRRELTAAASSVSTLYSTFKLTAKNDAPFMKAIAAKPGASLLKDAVANLAAGAAEIAKGMVAGLNAAAADGTLKTALQAMGLSAALIESAVKAAKEIKASDITVDTKNIGGSDGKGGQTNFATLEKEGYKAAAGNAAPKAAASTSAAGFMFVSVAAAASSLMALL